MTRPGWLRNDDPGGGKGMSISGLKPPVEQLEDWLRGEIWPLVGLESELEGLGSL